MGNLFSFDMIRSALISAVPALVCITVHELAHGFTAYKLGDSTAKEMGRLTLNPIKHVDIVGLAMILFLGFGWAKPVPVNMGRFKNPKGHMALTSLAGPLSNIVLAVATAFIFMLMPFPYGGFQVFVLANTQHSGELPIMALMVNRLMLINVFLAVFNMLPIPPLDGSKVIFSLLSEKTYYKLMRYERYGMIFLLALMFSGRFLSFDIFNMLIGMPALSLFVGIAEFAHNAVASFT